MRDPTAPTSPMKQHHTLTFFFQVEEQWWGEFSQNYVSIDLYFHQDECRCSYARVCVYVYVSCLFFGFCIFSSLLLPLSEGYILCTTMKQQTFILLPQILFHLQVVDALSGWSRRDVIQNVGSTAVIATTINLPISSAFAQDDEEVILSVTGELKQLYREGQAYEFQG